MFPIIVNNNAKNERTTYYIYDVNEHIIIFPAISLGSIINKSYYDMELTDDSIIFKNTEKVIVNNEKIEEFLSTTSIAPQTKITLPFGYELTDEEYQILKQYYIEQVTACISDENFEEENQIKKDIQKVRKLITSK